MRGVKTHKTENIQIDLQRSALQYFTLATADTLPYMEKMPDHTRDLRALHTSCGESTRELWGITRDLRATSNTSHCPDTVPARPVRWVCDRHCASSMPVHMR